jgi:hypothetical protein
MDKELARNLSKINPLPTRLQDILWGLGDYEVKRNLAQNSNLKDEIAIEIIKCNEEELIQLLLTAQRTYNVLKYLQPEQINNYNRHLVIEQKKYRIIY